MEEKKQSKSGKRLESVTVNGKEYIRHKRDNRSSCAQCEIKAECWDMWHSAPPCYGGFYTRKKNKKGEDF